ncbi:hypothetical protein C8J56DRAFT_1169406 [Mycena floridula]|nr:hypothetical protein C8J56DRAFT_1169406 [Mycena floridula]
MRLAALDHSTELKRSLLTSYPRDQLPMSLLETIALWNLACAANQLGRFVSDSSDSVTSNFDFGRPRVPGVTTIENILARSVKLDEAPFLHRWSNNWSSWSYVFDLEAIFDSPRFEIFIETKFQLQFESIQLLMFQRRSDNIVFRYLQNYYRYDRRIGELFLYRGVCHAFLEHWEEEHGNEQQSTKLSEDSSVLRKKRRWT